MCPYVSIAAIVFAVLSLSPVAKGNPSVPPGITFFRADVTVREDATLEVHEEITVNDGASYYKYGFRRDLPITSNDRWDPRYIGSNKEENDIRVNILEVRQDGRPVTYTQGNGYGYSQILIGAQNTPLEAGEHRFELRYTVDGAMTSPTGHDRLYWNAIGVERNAPVAEAVVAIHLPATIPSQNIEVEPRVGGRGNHPKIPPVNSLERVDDSTGAIVYRAVNIAQRQSLSLAVSWPSGYIRQTKYRHLRRDGWMIVAPGIVFLYYLIAWFRIGPDPKPGSIQARYEPPEGLSPAGVRYIVSGTTDGRSFAAVIAHLAVCGCLRVEAVNGKYKLSQLMSDRATQASLAPEEERCLGLLFEDGPTIELSPALDQRDTAQNGRYVFHIHEELAKQLSNKYFTRHSGTIAIGVLMTLFFAAILAAMAKGRDTTGAFMLTFWILFCGLMIGMMIEVAFLSAWRTVARAGTGWTKMLPGTLAIAVFGGVIVFLLKKLSEGISLSYALVLVAFLLINLGWGPSLKRKTPLGRQVFDEIAGFRQFLEKVEQDQLNRLSVPTEASQNLEKLLPYAIALEVKEAWGDQLAQEFLAATVFTEQ